jgi:hypothetical protein
MSVTRAGIGWLMAASLLAGPSANAATNRNAAAMVAAAQTDYDALLKKFPALEPIDQVLRDDCASKVPGHKSSDGFCKCGAAVTMALWRTGADPKMVGRLTDFLNGKGELTAEDFVKFEGPELYKPVCEAGS